MMTQLSSNAEAIRAELKAGWGMILLRGILDILLGILLLIQPGRTLVTFTNIIAFFLLIDGIFTLVSSLLGLNWRSLIGALLSIIVAIFVLGHPLITTLIAASILLILLGLSALTSGLVSLWGAFQNRSELDDWLWVAFTAVVSIIFGLLILFGNSLLALAVFLQVVGVYTIIAGIVLVIAAFRFRNM
jgi:uncharacterized membrane protein HdeD (DUF308 family)